ncbi:MAG: hydroxyacylglutathione hydrolase [Deltaproteobacteria bacterium]|nr:hydroxyacylglutathione hydrolase [Deltaproteobacteria bacterium]
MIAIPVRCLRNNYAYLVACEETREAAVVDASEAAPVLQVARREGMRLRAVWSTHHHWDHVGGNEEIAREVGGLEVCGHGRVPAQTRALVNGECFALGRLEVVALHVPGHTNDALAYVVRHPAGAVSAFTGDTLFLAGCGRLFEGTPEQMLASLSRLARLPPEALIFCGHEYTVSNLRFAAHVEPSNPAIGRAVQAAEARLAAGQPTVPGTIATELEVNPFLRVTSSEIRERLAIAPSATDAEAFAAIRAAKDAFV